MPRNALLSQNFSKEKIADWLLIVNKRESGVKKAI